MYSFGYSDIGEYAFYRHFIQVRSGITQRKTL